jgi:transcription termination factor Rho
MDRTVLGSKALSELREIASTLELRGYQRMKKADLVDLIVTRVGLGLGEAGFGRRRVGRPPTARPTDRTGDRTGRSRPSAEASPAKAASSSDDER